MKTVRILALILAAGVAAPTVGWAQAGPPPAPPRQERPMKRELPPEAKELLERQREEIRALRQKHREERRALMEKLRQERGPVGRPRRSPPDLAEARPPRIGPCPREAGPLIPFHTEYRT